MHGKRVTASCTRIRTHTRRAIAAVAPLAAWRRGSPFSRLEREQETREGEKNPFGGGGCLASYRARRISFRAPSRTDARFARSGRRARDRVHLVSAPGIHSVADMLRRKRRNRESGRARDPLPAGHATRLTRRGREGRRSQRLRPPLAAKGSHPFLWRLARRPHSARHRAAVRSPRLASLVRSLARLSFVHSIHDDSFRPFSLLRSRRKQPPTRRATVFACEEADVRVPATSEREGECGWISLFLSLSSLSFLSAGYAPCRKHRPTC